jgi:hypothetical protein
VPPRGSTFSQRDLPSPLGSRRADRGLVFIRKFVFPVFQALTAVCLLVTLVVLVAGGAGKGLGPLVRSLAGVLLPIVLLAMVFNFLPQILKRAETLPAIISFGGMTVLGFGAMAVLLAGPAGAPVRELVMSASLCLLATSALWIEGDTGFAFYAGLVIGFLLYFILFSVA